MSYNNILPLFENYLSIVPKKDKEFFLLYIKWIQMVVNKCWVKNKNTSKVCETLYASVFNTHNPNTLIGKLQQEFVIRNLSLSLLTEPIDGFLLFAKNKYDLEFSKLSPIILQIISPISRFVTVLNNNSPLLYQPLTTLIFTYLMLYIKHSPKMQNHFKNNKIQINTKLLNEQILKSFQEAKYSIAISKNVIFKLKIGYFVGLLKVLIKKDTKKLKKMDYVNAFLYGLYYTLTIKGKKISFKQV